MALLTVIAVVMPLTLAERTSSQIATALINLAIGASIATIVDSVARTTRRPPSGLGAWLGDAYREVMAYLDSVHLTPGAFTRPSGALTNVLPGR